MNITVVLAQKSTATYLTLLLGGSNQDLTHKDNQQKNSHFTINNNNDRKIERDKESEVSLEVSEV